MTKKRHSKHLFMVLVVVCVASFLFAGSTLYNYITYKDRIVQAAKANARSETERIAKEIGGRLGSIEGVINIFAKEYGSKDLPDREVRRRLEEIMQKEPEIRRIGFVAVATSAESSTQSHFVRFERKEGKVRLASEEAPTDPKGEAWYKDAIAKGAHWSEPFFDEDAKKYEVMYSIPVYATGSERKDKSLAGVVFVSSSLGWLKDMMDSVNLEKKDFGIVLSKEGTILYHPMRDIVVSQTNIFTMLEKGKAENKNYDKQRSSMQKAVNGQSGDGFLTSRAGQSFWFFYRPISSAGWSIVVTFVKDAIPFNGKALRRQEIRIAIGFFLFLLTLVALVIRAYDLHEFKKSRLWCLSIVFSVFAMIIASYTWYLTLSIPLNEYQQDKTVIDDSVSLGKFFASYSKLSNMLYGKDPVFIPTGIYIQSLEFANSNNINISGYVWQKYTKGIHDTISRGFIMPQSKTISVTESYRRQEGNNEVVGWYFEATVRQTFDYSKYPFDQPDISIWLKHKDFLDNIVLVPDLNGYRYMNAMGFPGLQSKLALPGYSFFATFFSVEQKMTNANFGIISNKEAGRTPEFFYNIIIKRNFITPLVSKFFPILIVASMLFIVILSFSSDLEKQKNFGLTGLAVVGLVVSFFFSTLLTQIDLRQQFSADKIIFIENFNFVTYLILLMSAIQAFLFSTKKNIKFIQFEHCLIPKVLYWPIFAGLILVMNLIYFY